MAREAREQAKADGDQLGNSLDDAWIHTKIASKLIANTTFSARDQYRRREWHRDVGGIVDTPEAKAEALRVVMDTVGVKKLYNPLRAKVG